MKKITLYEFLGLPEQEQYHVVFNSGDYIDVRIEEEKRFVLYAVDMFFIEVEYDNKQNKIFNNRAFVSGEILNKYSQLKF